MNIFDPTINHFPLTITTPNTKVLWKVVARNNGSFNLNTGVNVQLAWSNPVVYHRRSDITDTQGVIFGNGTASGTHFNIATHLWNVGSLAVGQEKILIIETTLPAGTDLSVALPLTLTKTISVNSLTDVVIENNVSIDVLQSYCLDTPCGPTAAAVSGIGCRCTVANNDTPCNYGITEWRIVPGSLVNTQLDKLDFNPEDGTYSEYLTNPGIPGSFQYGIYCIKDGVEVSGPFLATQTILPLFNIQSLNHVPRNKTFLELTSQEILVLEAQYPDRDLEDFCWTIIYNGAGEPTGGVPLNCSEEQDTRTFFMCTSEACNDIVPPCVGCETPTHLPLAVYNEVMATSNYTPQIGDTIFLQHPEAHSVHTWNGSIFERNSCGCIEYGGGEEANPYPTAIIVTGTTTKTVTITMSEGPALTTTFTDLTGGGGGDMDIQHAPCSPSSGAGTLADPLVVDIPVPQHVFPVTSLEPGDTSVTINVSTMFTTPCAAGCTPTYTLGGFSSLVYENVTLVGTALTYDVKVNALAGNYPIVINRVCA